MSDERASITFLEPPAPGLPPPGSAKLPRPWWKRLAIGLLALATTLGAIWAGSYLISNIGVAGGNKKATSCLNLKVANEWGNTAHQHVVNALGALAFTTIDNPTPPPKKGRLAAKELRLAVDALKAEAKAVFGDLAIWRPLLLGAGLLEGAADKLAAAYSRSDPVARLLNVKIAHASIDLAGEQADKAAAAFRITTVPAC